MWAPPGWPPSQWWGVENKALLTRERKCVKSNELSHLSFVGQSNSESQFTVEPERAITFSNWFPRHDSESQCDKRLRMNLLLSIILIWMKRDQKHIEHNRWGYIGAPDYFLLSYEENMSRSVGCVLPLKLVSYWPPQAKESKWKTSKQNCLCTPCIALPANSSCGTQDAINFMFLHKF